MFITPRSILCCLGLALFFACPNGEAVGATQNIFDVQPGPFPGSAFNPIVFNYDPSPATGFSDAGSIINLFFADDKHINITDFILHIQQMRIELLSTAGDVLATQIELRFFDMAGLLPTLAGTFVNQTGNVGGPWLNDGTTTSYPTPVEAHGIQLLLVNEVPDTTLDTSALGAIFWQQQSPTVGIWTPNTNPVPEPASILMFAMGAGMLGLVGMRRRRKLTVSND